MPIADQLADFASRMGAQFKNLRTGAGTDVGYQLHSGAQKRDMREKLGERVTILDFMTPAQRADVLARTRTLDVTAAVQAAIDWTGPRKKKLIFIGDALTGPLTAPYDDIHWEAERGASLVFAPLAGGYDLNAFHVSITGARPCLTDLVGVGNQDAMASGAGSGLLISGASPSLHRVAFTDYPGRNYVSYSNSSGRKKGVHIDCVFDDAAGLGFEALGAAYMDFLGCSFNRCGYGWKRTWETNLFAAFGKALRFRSHDITFVACSFNRNGRDGANVNQGSNAIRYSQCECMDNGDGGFTIAADNTSTDLPGEGENPFDLEYMGCYGARNFTSGLVAYQAVRGLKVVGGAYFNNGVVAGDQVAQTSFAKGIYVAGGSSDLVIDTQTYDDRQAVTVSANSGGVLTAPGWVPGTGGKVALFNANGAFQGYARVTAESAGSVTISPTSFNGVTLASIVSGWTVTQAVQNLGVCVDNGSQGSVSPKGFGHRVGPAGGPSGKLFFSGTYANGQSIALGGPGVRVGAELIANPDFAVDMAGWGISVPGGGAWARETTGELRGVACLRLTAGTSGAEADAPFASGALSRLLGSNFGGGVWCYCPQPGKAFLSFFWFQGATPRNRTTVHPGGGWAYLPIGGSISEDVTGLVFRLGVASGFEARFCACSLKPADVLG